MVKPTSLDSPMLLARMLDALRIAPDRPVMVHAAFRKAGELGLDAAQFAEALGHRFAAGAVLMPAMSWRAVNPSAPLFDELATPSITGVLGEIFRKQVSSGRSLHPTHSVSGHGAAAASMLAEHHLDETPCSVRSPFGRLLQEGGDLIFLGLGIRYCTLLHHFEERYAPDIYLAPPAEAETYTCRRRDGAEFSVRLRRHRRVKRDFWRIEDILEKDGLIRHWDHAGLRAMAVRTTDLARVMDRELSRDPAALLGDPENPRSHF